VLDEEDVGKAGGFVEAGLLCADVFAGRAETSQADASNTGEWYVKNTLL
jgi:hypothetical protein